MYHDFSLSEYFDRVEKAHLSILAEREPIDKSITLWWGFDGLRLNEDGTLEWISRKPNSRKIENIQMQIALEMHNQKICRTLYMIDGCCGRDMTGKMIMPAHPRYSSLTQRW